MKKVKLSPLVYKQITFDRLIAKGIPQRYVEQLYNASRSEDERKGRRVSVIIDTKKYTEPELTRGLF